MHLKPLILVKSSRELSFAEAHKVIKKFHTTCVEKAASTLNLNHGKHEPTVSEDVLEKLSLLVDETKRQADLHPEAAVPSSAVKGSGSSSNSKEQKQKKRKRDSKEDDMPAAPVTPSIESSEKKKKKSKKGEK